MSAPNQAQKLALIVGVDEAKDSFKAPLRFAEASAQRLADVLATPACGFTVHAGAPLLGAAATAAVVRRTILRLLPALTSPDDLLVIAFVGHGIPLPGLDRDDVLLSTSDLDLVAAEADHSDCLSTGWLLKHALQHPGPGSVLVLLGCCHAGAIAHDQLRPEMQQLERRLDALGHRLGQHAPGTARMRRVLAAVDGHERAYEADGMVGFVRALIAGLQGEAADPQTGSVTFDTLAHYVSSRSAERVVRFGPEAGALALAHDARWRGWVAARRQPWVNVPARNPGFVGRNDELAQLATWLTGERAATATLMPAISGVGGMGKSQLAIQFAHRHCDSYPGGVFWIDAEQADTIALQIALCGGSTGLGLFDDDPRLSNQLLIGRATLRLGTAHSPLARAIEVVERDEAVRLTIQERAKRVLDVLAQSERRLLVFDNLEDPRLLDTWRPAGTGCHVLITTRNLDATLFGAHPLRLEPLDSESGLRLLAGPRAASQGATLDSILARPNTRAELLALGEELGWLPLALDLAGRYLGERTLSFASYLQHIRAESVRHASLTGDLANGLLQQRSASIVATFALSVAQLDAHDRDGRARRIWFAAAQLAPEPIDDRLLVRLAGDDPADAAAREAADRAIALLRQIGLIERDSASHRLHRLVRAYANQLSPDVPAALACAETAIVAEMVAAEERGSLTADATAFRSHLAFLADQLGDRDDLSAASVCQEYAEALYVANDFRAALPFYERAVAIRQARLGDNPLTAESLRDLGNALSNLGRHTDATRICLQALTILDTSVGRNHESTSHTLHQLGRVAEAEGDYTAARDWYTQALAAYAASVGRNNQNAAVTLYQLGWVAETEGDYPTARDWYTQALAAYDASVGRNNQNASTTLHQLGWVAQVEGNYAAAREWYTQALAASDASIGRNHESTARTLQQLGQVAHVEGDYPTARDWYTQALVACDASVGRNHEGTAEALHLLGWVAETEGDYPTARDWYIQALAAYDASVGRNHESTARTLHRLGWVAHTEGDYPTARDWYIQALAAYDASVGRNNESTSRMLHWLGWIAEAEGNYAAARDWYTQALAAKDASIGRNHESTAVTLHQLGWVAHTEGDYPTARDWYTQALAAYDASVGRNNQNASTTLHQLGWMAEAEGDYPTARDWYTQALAAKDASIGRNHESTARTLHRLGQVAHTEGDYPTARDWYTQALAAYDASVGRNNQNASTTLHQLGWMAEAEGDYPTARDWYTQALAAKDASIGRNHESTARTLHRLGQVAHTEGDYPTARDWYTQALAAYDASVGRNNQNASTTLHQLGWIAQDDRDYAAARDWYTQALAAKDASIGRNHESTAEALHLLGWIAEAEGNYAAARDWYTQALAAYDASVGRNNQNASTTLHHLGRVTEAEGDYAAAREWYTQALAASDASIGRNHESTALTLQQLGQVARVGGDYALARDWFTQALAAQDASVGRNNQNAAATLHQLGWIAEAEGDYAAARDWFTQALAAYDASVGRNHESAAATLLNLGHLELTRGHPERAFDLLAEAYQVYRTQLGETHEHTRLARAGREYARLQAASPLHRLWRWFTS